MLQPSEMQLAKGWLLLANNCPLPCVELVITWQGFCSGSVYYFSEKSLCVVRELTLVIETGASEADKNLGSAPSRSASEIVW